MAVAGNPFLKSNGFPADTSRPFPPRDELFRNVSNAGVRALFDLAFPFSYPGGSATNRSAAGNPAAGALVQDVGELNNGTVSLGTGGAGSVTYAGNGFDFTSANSGNTTDVGVILPAAVLADIFAAFGGASQRFLLALYLKMPAAANWPSGSGITPFAGDKNLTSLPSMLSMAFTLGTANVGRIESRRQVSAGTFETSQLNVTAEAEDLGTVCQIAFWRNAAGQGLRLRSLTSGKAAKTATKAEGVNNTQDFSVDTFTFGRPAVSGNGVLPIFSGVRLYRGFIENLARSGRDPVAVLDADFARQQTRALFS